MVYGSDDDETWLQRIDKQRSPRPFGAEQISKAPNSQKWMVVKAKEILVFIYGHHKSLFAMWRITKKKEILGNPVIGIAAILYNVCTYLSWFELTSLKRQPNCT